MIGLDMMWTLQLYYTLASVRHVALISRLVQVKRSKAVRQTSRSELRGKAGMGMVRIAGACLFAVVCGGMPAGCAAPNKSKPLTADNPNAVVAFNEMCNHALSEDVAYLRDHMTPEQATQLVGAKDDPAADKPLKDFMGELWYCRAQSIEKSVGADRVVVQVARTQPAPIRVFSVDMTFDKQKGWLLASKLYGERPLLKVPEAPK
jgi:hypothetical protein